MNFVIKHGDALYVLSTIKDGTVQVCVTSPPYYSQRDYGTATFIEGDPSCSHEPDAEWIHHNFMANSTLAPSNGDKEHTQAAAARMRWYKQTPGKCPRCSATRVDDQIGLETTPDLYIARMVDVFRQVRRVLTPNGVCWINIGDSYSGGGKGNYGQGISKGEGQFTNGSDFKYPGIQPKEQVGIPWMLAFALRADGWMVRQEVIWAKPAPQPESVTDRCTRSHESLFMLVKSPEYYWDKAAIDEPATSADDDESTRNKRDVWMIATDCLPDEHYAPMPQDLVTPCVLSSSKAGDVILDPFCGSGTVGIVALRHGRRFIGIDLSSVYCDMSRRRIAGPLFTSQEGS